MIAEELPTESYIEFIRKVMQTKPEEQPDSILKQTIYNNSAQNPDIARVLFVCSMGMLRSPTAAAIGVKHGLNTRSCGTEADALITLDDKLIHWADIIVFMHVDNYINAFCLRTDIDVLKPKVIVWNVPDDYDYMEDSLVWIIENKIKGLLNE